MKLEKTKNPEMRLGARKENALFFQKFALKNVPIPPMPRIGPGRIVMDLFALFSTLFKIQGHETNDQYHYDRNKNISYLEI